MASDGIQGRFGNQKFLLLFRSVKHDGTPTFDVGPQLQQNAFDLYGVLPDDIARIPTPPLMDPQSVSFHLESLFVNQMPHNVRLQPTFLDSPKGHAKIKKNAAWTASLQGGLHMPATLIPLYPGERVRLFGYSRWTWTVRSETQRKPTAKTAVPIVIGALFSLQWTPLRKSDRNYEVLPNDPTTGLYTMPRQEHGASLARNTPWAKKMKLSGNGASRLQAPKKNAVQDPDGVRNSRAQSGSVDDELDLAPDGTPMLPRRTHLPEEARKIDWAAPYRK